MWHLQWYHGEGVFSLQLGQLGASCSFSVRAVNCTDTTAPGTPEGKVSLNTDDVKGDNWYHFQLLQASSASGGAWGSWMQTGQQVQDRCNGLIRWKCYSHMNRTYGGLTWNRKCIVQHWLAGSKYRNSFFFLKVLKMCSWNSAWLSITKGDIAVYRTLLLSWFCWILKHCMTALLCSLDRFWRALTDPASSRVQGKLILAATC